MVVRRDRKITKYAYTAAARIRYENHRLRNTVSKHAKHVIPHQTLLTVRDVNKMEMRERAKERHSLGKSNDKEHSTFSFTF
jgi:hypothetical protein